MRHARNRLRASWRQRGASDAEQQLLAQPVVARPAVEPVGDLAQQRVVVLDVSVEQQQRHPPDVGDPDLRSEPEAASQADHHLGGGARIVPQQAYRQAVGV